MTATILDGAAVAKRLREEMAAKVKTMTTKPGLAVVLVGEDPASQVYVRNKGKAAEETGINSWTHTLPATTTEGELLSLITKLNNDPAVHGILVQMPVPKHIDSQCVINAIDPAKDVDGFHPMNVGRLSTGLPSLVPCTPQGCMILLGEAHKKLDGMNALVIGRSNIVGKPVAQLLLNANCTVTIAHSKTHDLPTICSRADIVVAAIGRAEFVKGAWIKPGATVIDVGINRTQNPSNPGKTKLVGDVEFEASAERAGFITPVPGGVGPMTIACLLRNTLQAASESKRGVAHDHSLYA